MSYTPILGFGFRSYIILITFSLRFLPRNLTDPLPNYLSMNNQFNLLQICKSWFANKKLVLPKVHKLLIRLLVQSLNRKTIKALLFNIIK